MYESTIEFVVLTCTAIIGVARALLTPTLTVRGSHILMLFVLLVALEGHGF